MISMFLFYWKKKQRRYEYIPLAGKLGYGLRQLMMMLSSPGALTCRFGSSKNADAQRSQLHVGCRWLPVRSSTSVLYVELSSTWYSSKQHHHQ